MIENATIEGRPALISYLNDQFEPVDPEAATLVKAVFTDEKGGSIFLVPDAPAKQPTK